MSGHLLQDLFCRYPRNNFVSYYPSKKLFTVTKHLFSLKAIPRMVTVIHVKQGGSLYFIRDAHALQGGYISLAQRDIVRVSSFLWNRIAYLLRVYRHTFCDVDHFSLCIKPYPRRSWFHTSRCSSHFALEIQIPFSRCLCLQGPDSLLEDFLFVLRSWFSSRSVVPRGACAFRQLIPSSKVPMTSKSPFYLRGTYHPLLRPPSS